MAKAKKVVVTKKTPVARKPRIIKAEPPKEEVVLEVSTAKEKLQAYMAELARKDPHEFAVREAELRNQLNQL